MPEASTADFGVVDTEKRGGAHKGVYRTAAGTLAEALVAVCGGEAYLARSLLPTPMRPQKLDTPLVELGRRVPPPCEFPAARLCGEFMQCSDGD